MPRALFEWLARRAQVALVVADGTGLVTRCAPGHEQGATSAWDGLEGGDLVVTRSRHPFALALLKQAEMLGARSRDSWATVQRVRDKLSCALALSDRGLPTPTTFFAERPADLSRLPEHYFPLLLKPVLGNNARGLCLVRHAGELASVHWDGEIVLAQRYVDTDGVDLKLYAAGAAVWAVRRPSPLAPQGAPPVRARVTPALRELVDACRDEFGLQLLGIDVLESKNGPVIVDVNEFPNYTGIEEAPEVIGRLVLDEALAGSRTQRVPRVLSGELA
jgi:ribosomal protein S6--L-glutamate ligase